MHHLIPKLMPIDITEALAGRFISQLGQEPSRCVPPGRQERTEARGLVSTVEWVLIRATAVADSSLRLSEHVALGIVSAENYSNCILHREEVEILSPRACRKKQIEFASGRPAAHAPLNHIGFANAFTILRRHTDTPLCHARLAHPIP